MSGGHLKPVFCGHLPSVLTQAVTTVVNGIKSIAANAHLRYTGLQGLAYNFFDLSLILQNQYALEMVLERINRSSDGGAQFLSWLEQFKTVSRIFSRFDKLDVMFAAFIHFALIVESLR